MSLAVATTINLIDSQESFWELEGAWRDLLSRCYHHTIFQSFEWLSRWWFHYGKQNHLYIFTIANSHNGNVIGIAPLMIVKTGPLKVAKFIGSGPSDYLDFIVDDGAEELAIASLFDELYARRMREWDILDLQQMPQSSSTGALIGSQAVKRHLPTLDQTQSICHHVILPPSWQEYILSVSQNMRSTLARKSRKLEREHHVEIWTVDSHSALAGALETLFELHQKRWTEAGFQGAFATSRIREFHRDVAAVFLDRGWLNLKLLLVEQIPVAAIYMFNYNGTVYYYLSGFDADRQRANYSIGMLMYWHSIRDAIDGGMRVFDFMRGDMEYKSKFGTMTARNLRLRVFAHSSIYQGYRAFEYLKKSIRPVTPNLARSCWRRLKAHSNTGLVV